MTASTRKLKHFWETARMIDFCLRCAFKWISFIVWMYLTWEVKGRMKLVWCVTFASQHILSFCGFYLWLVYCTQPKYRWISPHRPTTIRSHQCCQSLLLAAECVQLSPKISQVESKNFWPLQNHGAWTHEHRNSYRSFYNELKINSDSWSFRFSFTWSHFFFWRCWLIVAF